MSPFPVLLGLQMSKYGSLLVQKSQSASFLPSNLILTIILFLVLVRDIADFCLDVDWIGVSSLEHSCVLYFLYAYSYETSIEN